MNIAVYHNLPSGGAKRTLWNFMKLLKEQGHMLDLYTLSTSENNFLQLQPFAKNTYVIPYRFQEYLASGTPFIANTINLFRQQDNLTRLENTCREIARQINEGNYDVAFVHPCGFSQSPAVLKYLNIPSVYFCQEPPRFFYEPAITYDDLQESPSSSKPSTFPSVFRKISGLIYTFRQHKFKQHDAINARHATLILVNSCYSKETIYRIYGKFPRVNYLGVDPEMFVPLSEIKKEPVVLSVGRFDPLKQHHFVLKSVTLIAKTYRPSVVIIGDSSYSAYKIYLTQLAKKLGVRLTMLELISDNELVEWYNRAMVVAYPPILEPLGLVPLEAMACETPVVGVREGGIRETIVPGKTGFLLEREERHFAQVIETLLHDKTLRNRIGHAGREYVLNQWTWEHSIQALVRYFRSVCNSQR